MPPVTTLHLSDHRAFMTFCRDMAERFPALRFNHWVLDGGEAVLRPDEGGMKIHWLCQGVGEVFLPKGHRTKEGDSGPALGQCCFACSGVEGHAPSWPWVICRISGTRGRDRARPSEATLI